MATVSALEQLSPASLLNDIFAHRYNKIVKLISKPPKDICTIETILTKEFSYISQSIQSNEIISKNWSSDMQREYDSFEKIFLACKNDNVNIMKLLCAIENKRNLNEQISKEFIVENLHIITRCDITFAYKAQRRFFYEVACDLGFKYDLSIIAFLQKLNSFRLHPLYSKTRSVRNTKDPYLNKQNNIPRLEEVVSHCTLSVLSMNNNNVLNHNNKKNDTTNQNNKNTDTIHSDYVLPEKTKVSKLLWILNDTYNYCFIAYLANPFRDNQPSRWYSQLEKEIPFKTIKKQDGTLYAREVAWVANCGCYYAYGYKKSIVLKPIPFSKLLKDITMMVCSILAKSCFQFGFMVSYPPNCCHISKYKNGKDWLGQHSDDEDIFVNQNIAHIIEMIVISLSLGQPRKMLVNQVCGIPFISSPLYLLLENGDLNVMCGQTQLYYHHGIPKDVDAKESRINLTWRWIVNHKHK